MSCTHCMRVQTRNAFLALKKERKFFFFVSSRCVLYFSLLKIKPKLFAFVEFFSPLSHFQYFFFFFIFVQVGWLRAADQTVLALQDRVVTHNARISVSHENYLTWRLRIKQLRETDKGCYMCQINSSPMKKQIGCIDVQSKQRKTVFRPAFIVFTFFFVSDGAFFDCWLFCDEKKSRCKG